MRRGDMGRAVSQIENYNDVRLACGFLSGWFYVEADGDAAAYTSEDLSMLFGLLLRMVENETPGAATPRESR